jgi:hypothetical protein
LENIANGEGEMIHIPETGTCPLLQPYHVSSGKLFVRERFDNFEFVDLDLVTDCIENKLFPVPEEQSHQKNNDLAGLVRAADLIGQLRDLSIFTKFLHFFTNVRNWSLIKQWGANYQEVSGRGAPIFLGSVHKVCGRWC